jgi:hypothetical protein
LQPPLNRNAGGAVDGYAPALQQAHPGMCGRFCRKKVIDLGQAIQT